MFTISFFILNMSSSPQKHSNSTTRLLGLAAVAASLSLAAIWLVENMRSRASSVVNGNASNTPISEKMEGPMLAVSKHSYRNNEGHYRATVDSIYGTDGTPTSPSVLAWTDKNIPADTPRAWGAAVHIPNFNAVSRRADIDKVYGIRLALTPDSVDISKMTDEAFIDFLKNGDSSSFFETEEGQEKIADRIRAVYNSISLGESEQLSKEEDAIFQEVLSQVLLWRAARIERANREKSGETRTYKQMSDDLMNEIRGIK